MRSVLGVDCFLINGICGVLCVILVWMLFFVSGDFMIMLFLCRWVCWFIVVLLIVVMFVVCVLVDEFLWYVEVLVMLVFIGYGIGCSVVVWMDSSWSDEDIFLGKCEL